MTNASAMETRKAGTTGLELSLLGVGVWVFGGTEGDYWGAHDEAEARDLIAACLDRGVTYFDVAEAYNEGRSEEALGRVLKGRRHEAVIGTKVSPVNCAPRAKLRQHCEASLRRLATDYVDLYMVHWPLRDQPVEEAFAELEALRQEGKIRTIGVSNFGPVDLAEALGTGAPIGVNQMHYNLFSRAIEAGILPMCRENNVGVMTYMSLLQGILTGKYASIDQIPPIRTRTRHFRGDRPNARHGGPGAEDLVQKALAEFRPLAASVDLTVGQMALAWLAARPGVSCVLAGARNVEQLEHNIAGVMARLPAEVMRRLDELTDPILEKLGDNADYWQSGADCRIR